MKMTFMGEPGLPMRGQLWRHLGVLPPTHLPATRFVRYQERDNPTIPNAVLPLLESTLRRVLVESL